jgi:hypothetical protein
MTAVVIPPAASVKSVVFQILATAEPDLVPAAALPDAR